jgi:RNA polymerase sigma factor (sigma-70 family)
VDIDHLELAAVLPDDKTLLVDEALEQLKEKDPETARVVLLKFFGGLTNEEIVEVTGASERTVRRQWNYAKAWLYKRMQQL